MNPTNYTDVGLSIFYVPSVHHTLGLSVEHQVLGSDSQLFSLLGLEEFSPQPGTTVSFSYEVRW